VGAEDMFRYRVEPSAERNRPHPDVLSEFVQSQLRNLLDIVVPCTGETEVRVDGYRLLGPDGGVHGLYDGEGRRDDADRDRDGYRNMANAGLYEPRIEYIARQLRDILTLVELESEGKPVAIDGFRLKNLEDWAGSRVASASDVLMHASSRCDLNCVFCYNSGAIDSLAWHKRSSEEELSEMQTRLSLYDASGGTGLFPSYGSPHEFMANPRAIEILAELRRKTQATLRICTNGTKLEESTVARFKEAAPVYLDVSLNSASPRRRSALMGDDHPETAIRSLELLKKYGIPFSVIVVMWPFPSLAEALEDLAITAAYAEDNLAVLVQVNLPGYTRFFTPRPSFDTEEVWQRTVEHVHGLREHLGCPIVIRPSLYEENLTRDRKNMAEVIGTVIGSPASKCGLEPGDIIAMVNGIKVANRAQARDLLTILQGNGTDSGTLTVRRGGRLLELEIRPADCGFPFTPFTATHLGAVFMGTGLRQEYLERMRNILLAHDGGEVLLLSSRLVKPTLEQMLEENPWYVPEGTRLQIEVPENDYFGGNIILGDLLLVQDLIDFIKRYLRETGSQVDLILIPSSPFYLGGWKRDLSGRPYLDIEREVGIPVALIECDPMWD
jgi:pyruvate-formate lyase-activating enzyme